MAKQILQSLPTFQSAIPSLEHLTADPHQGVPGHDYVRDELGKIFDPTDTYTLFRTVANQVAVNELPKREILPRQRFESDKDFRVMYREGDWQAKEKEQLRFSTRLLDLYTGTLQTVAEERFGKKNYVSFDSVQYFNFAGDGRDYEAVFEPTVHVIRGSRRHENFPALVNGLCGNEALAIIKKREAPQNYSMGEVKLLHSKQIPPLALDKNVLQASGTELARMVDFLVPTAYVGSCDHGSSDD